MRAGIHEETWKVSFQEVRWGQGEALQWELWLMEYGLGGSRMTNNINKEGGNPRARANAISLHSLVENMVLPVFSSLWDSDNTAPRSLDSDPGCGSEVDAALEEIGLPNKISKIIKIH